MTLVTTKDGIEVEATEKQIEIKTKSGQRTCLQYTNSFGFQIALKDSSTLEHIDDSEISERADDPVARRR